jgi:branched-chain amino acid transport system ATP-binding protein
MAAEESEFELLEGVEWLVDDHGTAYFVHEGQRYELDEEGYAVAVADGGTGPRREDGRTAATAAASAQVHKMGFDTMDATEPIAPQGHDTPGGDGSGGGVLLALEGVKSGYGQLPVLHDVTFAIDHGQTAVMLGLNGAGKTTTALNISGALKTWGGTIRFDGNDITSWNTRRCVRDGIVLVPEGRRVFPDLTVARNLQIGGWMQRRDRSWLGSQRELVLDYFPRLRERLGQLAGTLSGGEQQMLAIARGLMARPRLLIIDEASMGLAPVIVHDVFEIIRQINQGGVTVLLIEQNVGALEVADLGLVMEQGHIIRELRGSDLTDRSVVTEALMG